MEVNNNHHTSHTTTNTTNSEDGITINLNPPDIHFSQNRQNQTLTLPLLNNDHSPSSTVRTDKSFISSFDYNNSQLTCSYQQQQQQQQHALLKESKTAQTQTIPTSELTIFVQLNPPISKENQWKKITFNFNFLNQKISTISVRRFLMDNNDHNDNHDDGNDNNDDYENGKNDDNNDRKQNRHLSDIELLRQVYNELRQKMRSQR